MTDETTPDETAAATPEPDPELDPAAALELPSLDGSAPAASGHDLTVVLDVPVELAVEVGRTTMTIRETIGIAPGTLITLDRMTGEPVDLLVNGRRIARGEIVAIDEEFGLRVTEVVAGASALAAAE